MADSRTEEDLCPESGSPTDFVPPSIVPTLLHSGASYTHFSPVPPSLLSSTTASTATIDGPPCILGIDEAGRGPVLGPMVYGCFYLPTTLSAPLLKTEHAFNDSKVLTPTFRASLMRTLCTPESSLHDSCGWAVTLLSASSISAGMLKPSVSYNLNQQAMDATIALIEGVYERGVDVREIYVDTVGPPVTYEKVLAKRFPRAKVRVEKKADSLFEVVSAASVVAKVTRDVALEDLYKTYVAWGKGGKRVGNEEEGSEEEASWGSGYPSDARCTAWMKRNMDPVFGWGAECRFSWGTAKDLLEFKDRAVKVDWPVDEDDQDTFRVTDYFGKQDEDGVDELGSWFGRPVGSEVY